MMTKTMFRPPTHLPEGPSSLVERAYALAKSGNCRGIDAIKIELRKQGYNQYEVRQAFEGAALRRDIRRLCQEARGVKPKANSNGMSSTENP